MDYIFTDEDIKNKVNIVDIPEDNLVLYGEKLSGEGKNYIITGKAEIDGEIYHEFAIEFELVSSCDIPKKVMDTDWEWYDYLI
ncbi:MAG: hypothetical protein VB120_01760 [Lachnospiraceae bacterium]|nr:hypothetical protein [Lachnospiraceae bacterium]